MNVIDFLNYRMEKTAKAGKVVKKVSKGALSGAAASAPKKPSPKKPAPKKPSIPLKPSLKKAILSKDTAKGALAGSLMSPALFFHGPSGMAIPDAFLGPAIGGTAGTVNNYLKQKKDIKKAKEAAKALAAAGATGTVATQVKTAASKSQLALAKIMKESKNPIIRKRGEKRLAQHYAGRKAAEDISKAVDMEAKAFPLTTSDKGTSKQMFKYRRSGLRNIKKGQNPKGFVNLKDKMSLPSRRSKVDRYMNNEILVRAKRLRAKKLGR